jgi:hypothetical protein
MILHEDLSFVKKLAPLVSKLLAEEQKRRASESVIVMLNNNLTMEQDNTVCYHMPDVIKKSELWMETGQSGLKAKVHARRCCLPSLTASLDIHSHCAQGRHHQCQLHCPPLTAPSPLLLV